jgi:hypothetical protein
MDIVKWNYAEDGWLNVGDTAQYTNLWNSPFYNSQKENGLKPGISELAVLTSIDYIYYAVKFFCGVKLLPLQAALLDEIIRRPFPMLLMSRGGGKTYMLAIHSIMKALFNPEHKVVIAGAGFRQSKQVFENVEKIWNSSPMLRSVCTRNSGPRHDNDRWTFHLNDSTIVAVPVGTGDKIRGLRAHTIVADEFASHNPDIYETVIAPFSAVESQPAEGVQKVRMREILIEQGLWDEDAENAFGGKTENQSILTGTASYSFNHFYDYYKRYKGIIESRGDEKKLMEVLNGEIPENFNWKDYSIIRIPFSHMPKGFMSEKNISRAKATIHSTIYKMEYECCFCDDSDGFFKRSLIESCVAKTKNIGRSDWPSWCPFPFEATTRGDINKKYVYGIDPAFEVDNFSISVLELNDNHSRLVYVWTINKARFLEAIKLGITTENDYYQFCARKIRDLMKVFPAMAIGIDAQGGGTTIEQALRDKTKLEDGEVPLWPIIEEKKKETDSMPGLHILHMIQFANPTWTSEANYGLLQDLQGKMLLFPQFDQISLEIASGQDLMREKEFKERFGKNLTIFDSLEDCVLEIEETKEELSSIRVTRTGSGVNSRERWSTPETKLSGNRKGYLRKDRYSSLLIANYLARLFRNKLPQIKYESHGGFVKNFKPKNNLMYSGPEWVTRKTNK